MPRVLGGRAFSYGRGTPLGGARLHVLYTSSTRPLHVLYTSSAAPRVSPRTSEREPSPLEPFGPFEQLEPFAAFEPSIMPGTGPPGSGGCDPFDPFDPFEFLEYVGGGVQYMYWVPRLVEDWGVGFGGLGLGRPAAGGDLWFAFGGWIQDLGYVFLEFRGSTYHVDLRYGYFISFVLFLYRLRRAEVSCFGRCSFWGGGGIQGLYICFSVMGLQCISYLSWSFSLTKLLCYGALAYIYHGTCLSWSSSVDILYQRRRAEVSCFGRCSCRVGVGVEGSTYVFLLKSSSVCSRVVFCCKAVPSWSSSVHLSWNLSIMER